VRLEILAHKAIRAIKETRGMSDRLALLVLKGIKATRGTRAIRDSRD
jgi:hypothetical protein